LERLLDRETTTSSFRKVLSHYDVRSMTRHRELGVFVDDLLRADFANSQSGLVASLAIEWHHSPSVAI
jgi:hypothetical protein